MEVTDHTHHCRDLDCKAHGKYLRRIQRLQRAVASERAYLEETERALDINSEAVRSLRKRLAQAWDAWFTAVLDDELEDGTKVLAYVLETNPELRERLERALEGRTT